MQRLEGANDPATDKLTQGSTSITDQGIPNENITQQFSGSQMGQSRFLYCTEWANFISTMKKLAWPLQIGMHCVYFPSQ